MAEIEKPKQEELVYHPAHRGKRALAFLIDFVLTVLLSMTLFSLVNMAASSLPLVREQTAIRLELQKESGLYMEDSQAIYEYTASESCPLLTYGDKKDFLSLRLTGFYANDKFSNASLREEYDKRKIDAHQGDVFLFSIGSEGTIKENSVNPNYLYDFYVTEIKDYAMAELFKTGDYAEASRKLFLYGAIEFFLCLTISICLFYLLFPLAIWKRGRQTIGKHLLHLALIGSDAINIRAKQYLFRFLFIYFVYYLLDFFAFLIPFAISTGMLFFSKRKENLVDYLFSQYVVDVSYDTIYLNYEDYLEAKRMKEAARLENPDFRLSK